MNNVSAPGEETFCSPGSGRAPAAAFPGQGRATPAAPGHRQFGERTARAEAGICGFPPIGRPAWVPSSTRDFMDQKEMSVKKGVQNDY